MSDTNNHGYNVPEEGTLDWHELVNENFDAFDVGASDEHINSINADGVALAAIQGLSKELDEREDRIDDLEGTVDQQRAELADTREELAATREELAGREDRIDDLEATVEDQREEIDALREELAAIHDRLDEDT